MHGKIDFDLQRYQGRESEFPYTYFSLTNQFSEGYISPGLQELSAYYANRLSYRDVSELLERLSGDGQLSFSKVEDIVLSKALEISQIQNEEAPLLLESNQLPEISCDFDLYDESIKEVLVLEDGIQVKKQKDRRCKDTCETEDGDSSNRVNTDVIVLEQNNGSFRYITAGINKSGEELLSLEDAIKCELVREYAVAKAPLNIVVISDGARSIRKRMIRIFGENVCIILDWYHLNKKLRDLMSMIAINKKEKVDHLINLRGLLWEGKVDQALDYLDRIRCKNEQKLNELRTYFNKHKLEIVNYEQRKAANKCIGSGRVEKAVDLVIGNRQKKKGMSWSDLGSKSLGILKVVELNDEWDKIWHTQKWAA